MIYIKGTAMDTNENTHWTSFSFHSRFYNEIQMKGWCKSMKMIIAFVTKKMHNRTENICEWKISHSLTWSESGRKRKYITNNSFIICSLCRRNIWSIRMSGANHLEQSVETQPTTSSLVNQAVICRDKSVIFRDKSVISRDLLCHFRD